MRGDTNIPALLFLIWLLAISVAIIVIGNLRPEYNNEVDPTMKTSIETSKIGIASWYEYCIGDWCNTDANTCAVRHLIKGKLSDDLGVPVKRGAYLIVENMDNGKMWFCQTTDYGPEYAVHPDRIIDLSPHVFDKLSDAGTKLGVLKNIRVEYGWQNY